MSEMNYMLSAGDGSEGNIEVHKYYGGMVLLTSFLALVLQAFLHKYGHWAELIDLPLLVTIYFGVSRRNPVSGLFLGAAIGIIQDGLSHDNPIGMFGIAKTLVGYIASSVGARVDTEHPASRFGLIFLFFHFHQIVLTIMQRVLLDEPERVFSGRLLLDSLVTAAFGVVLFALLDRLRKPS
jgi:rod shape-determining protein MreD